MTKDPRIHSQDAERPTSPSIGGIAGRVALVTGGGRGIGAAISLALAKSGALVAVNWRRDEAAAKEVVDSIRRDWGTAIAVQAPVDDPDLSEEMVQQVRRELGDVSILVNNAGIASRGQAVVDTSPRETEHVMRVHALAPEHLCRLVVPAMRSMERGDIVMVSSVAAHVLGANGGPYNMAKAALEAWP